MIGIISTAPIGSNDGFIVMLRSDYLQYLILWEHYWYSLKQHAEAWGGGDGNQGFIGGSKELITWKLFKVQSRVWRCWSGGLEVVESTSSIAVENSRLLRRSGNPITLGWGRKTSPVIARLKYMVTIKERPEWLWSKWWGEVTFGNA